MDTFSQDRFTPPTIAITKYEVTLLLDRIWYNGIMVYVTSYKLQVTSYKLQVTSVVV